MSALHMCSLEVISNSVPFLIDPLCFVLLIHYPPCSDKGPSLQNLCLLESDMRVRWKRSITGSDKQHTKLQDSKSIGSYIQAVKGNNIFKFCQAPSLIILGCAKLPVAWLDRDCECRAQLAAQLNQICEVAPPSSRTHKKSAVHGLICPTTLLQP
ncbi:uncharacterized protein BO95DRAFT_515685, partial [Aspergillus brunneoviolaceus CBS 621.78]